ncbi:hypothetical protein BDR06DRAFT_962678 [Suillus hirtellus]|nr:hypothetical protein BDR06DRAFT_962678 [Suillus hirtellus]
MHLPHELIDIMHPVTGEHNSMLILAHIKYFHSPSLAVAVVWAFCVLMQPSTGACRE